MGTELELKLVGDEAALQRLLESPLVTGRCAGPAHVQHLASIYYDTPDRRLQGRRIALRVREKDGRYIQTLKTGDGHLRGEWETEIASKLPDLDALAEAAGEEAVASLRGLPLEPVYLTEVDRSVLELAVGSVGNGAARIELALDRGVVRAGRKTESLRELELELMEGEPAALYRLGLELQGAAGLRLEPVSKALRGALLATGEPPPYAKAGKLELKQDTTVDRGMEAIFGACLQHFQANLATAIDGREPEGVHQLRVSLRRLRSAFTTFRMALPEGAVAGFRDDMKWILSALGPARDLDVIQAEVLAPVLARAPEGQGLNLLLERTERARARARKAVRAALLDPRCTTWQLKLGGWIAERGWSEGAEEPVRYIQDQPLTGFARHLLDKRLKAAKKRGRHIEQLDARQRHELRIALKKLRYAIEFFQSLFAEKRVKPALKALASLQDQLGAMNDVHTAEAVLLDLSRNAKDRGTAESLAHARGLATGWQGGRIAAREADVAELWRKFIKTRPFWHA